MNFLRLSLASASLLGFKKTKTDTQTTTIYLMNSGGCTFNCSFCAQAKKATSKQQMLSRVSWPEYDLQIILKALKEQKNKYKRICFQTVNTKDLFQKLPEITKKIKSANPKAKLALSIRTYNSKHIDELFASGADQIGLAIDAINPNEFKKIKGSDFQKHKDFILKVAKKYPGKIATHLIIGLNESEKETIKLLKELTQAKVIIALFAFTPVKGAKLELQKPPEMKNYRRIQIALYLIKNNLDKKFKFDSKEQITNFGYQEEKLYQILKNSNVFETSGCKDCNRPYYNEKANDKELYNYPFKLNEKTFKKVLENIFL